MRSSYESEATLASAPLSFPPDALQVTDEDIERELMEIRELEFKKRALEERVSGMERDLGGLMS